jgi:uncharacterized protein YndB with AHSA1/START domain
MAGKVSVTVERRFDHPVEKVFHRYTDHEGWTRWAGFGRVTLVREGAPDRNGLGSVRAFQAAPGLREEVTRWEPPGRMEYKVVAGPVPMSDHLGEVMFESDGKGTRVTWRVSFQPGVPGTGWVMRRGLDFIFNKALDGLAKDLLALR